MSRLSNPDRMRSDRRVFGDNCGRPHDDNADLVRRLRDGDAATINRFVTDQWPRLVALARSILHCEHDASDAAQDALITALKRIHDLKEPAALEGWLNRIVANAALARLRTRRRKRERPIEDLLPTFYEDGHRIGHKGNWTVTPGTPLESEEMRELVRACIDELQDGYRKVILLRDIMGLDTQHAADVLGIAANNVKVRLHRARQALRTLIEERLETPCPSP